MGTYADRDDVKIRLHKTFPTDDYEDRIGELIGSREAFVEGELSTLYTVPITGTKALRAVKSIVSDYAASDLIFESRQLDENEERYARYLLERAEVNLKKIMDGDIVLTDAVSGEDEGILGYDGYDDMDSDDQEALEPVFTRQQMYDDKKPW